MSFFSGVVDAWATDLTTNVTGLSTAVVHKYAPWSPEVLYAERGERHLAIWPSAEPEVTEPLLVDGSVLAEQTYTVLVWEDTAGDAERLVENATDDATWLTLYEGIRARFFLTANNQLGSATIMATRYAGGSFSSSGHLRVMELSFRVAVPHLFS